MFPRARLSCFVVLICLLSACHGPPQNAADLLKRMPRRYQGEVRGTGLPTAYKLVVEGSSLSLRDEHTLEFAEIGYKVTTPADNNSIPDSTAAIRGTISAPGGEIVIESTPTAGDMSPVPGTFHGKLSADLDAIEASWKTASGAEIQFHGKAVR